MLSLSNLLKMEYFKKKVRIGYITVIFMQITTFRSLHTFTYIHVAIYVILYCLQRFKRIVDGSSKVSWVQWF